MQVQAHLASILVVEDNREMVALLRRVLSEQGYSVVAARDGNTGLAMATDQRPDLIILDVGLPYKNGFEVIEELRQRGVDTSTQMLNRRSGVSDRVTGLESGADDYLVKPFDPDELVARVRALLRRASKRGLVARLRVGDLVLDPLSREVVRGRRSIALTDREFSLLECLMRNAGTPLSRAEITAQAWGYSTDDDEATNIVDVYVAYLRRKIDADDEPMLRTVRGVGYMLRDVNGTTDLE
jgi:two-component system response regulator MprA